MVELGGGKRWPWFCGIRRKQPAEAELEAAKSESSGTGGGKEGRRVTEADGEAHLLRSPRPAPKKMSCGGSRDGQFGTVTQRQTVTRVPKTPLRVAERRCRSRSLRSTSCPGLFA